MTNEPLRVGISTCPNDTFTFAALLEGLVPDVLGMSFELEDIQTLNDQAAAGYYDVAKVSFHAALHLAEAYCVLPVGAALGFGVGPLLLASDESLAKRQPREGDTVWCPGRWTTASLLYRLYCPQGPIAQQTVFSDIMPRLKESPGYGVVIHEGRFTYEQAGLHLAKDLGQCWEQDTNEPLPLGGLIAKRSLGPQKLASITDAVAQSLQMAQATPQMALPVMSRYAQEFTEEVLWEHVQLYVNQTTAHLGEQGEAALQTLVRKAREASLIKAEVDLF